MRTPLQEHAGLDHGHHGPRGGTQPHGGHMREPGVRTRPVICVSQAYVHTPRAYTPAPTPTRAAVGVGAGVGVGVDNPQGVCLTQG